MNGIGMHSDTGIREALAELRVGRWLHQHLSGRCSTAYQQLRARDGTMPDACQDGIDEWMGDRALRQWDHAPAGVWREARTAFPVHREAHMVAVVPRLVARDRRRDRWGHDAGVPQQRGYTVRLPCQLLFVGEVL